MSFLEEVNLGDRPLRIVNGAKGEKAQYELKRESYILLKDLEKDSGKKKGEKKRQLLREKVPDLGSLSRGTERLTI